MASQTSPQPPLVILLGSGRTVSSQKAVNSSRMCLFSACYVSGSVLGAEEQSSEQNLQKTLPR